MKTSKLIGLTVIFIMVFSLWCGLSVKPANADITMQFGTGPITSNNADQVNPDIYQYGPNWWAAVWQDNRNGNWDIYIYSQHLLGDGNWDVHWDSQITANSGNNMSPKIYGEAIVYQSDRNGNWDIYMYNLTSKVETQITTNTANQGPCAVYGDIIVWQDWRNMVKPSQYLDTYPGMDIYMYNLTSHSEELLPLPETACYAPAISEDRVVYYGETYWTGYSGVHFYTPYICAYNLSSGQKFNVAVGKLSDVPWSWDPRAMSTPALDGPITAWTEKPEDSGWTIAVKNVSDGFVWRSGLATGPYNPDVSGPYVVYQGIINGNWDIYIYDTINDAVFDVTENVAGQQENPAISSQRYGDFFVYQDNRNGNWDIYLAAFWYGPMSGGTGTMTPITPSYVIGNLQEVISKIVNTPMSGFAGANNKVKENRKNVLINTLDSAIANIEDAVNTQNLNVRKANLQCSMNQLKSLINKVDGWSLRWSADIPGSRFTPDWITYPAYMDQMIRSCRNDLQILLDGIT